MQQTYNIAFAAVPKDIDAFFASLKQLSADDGVEILGAIIDNGPGCTNLGVLIEQNDAYIEALALALMPSKCSKCSHDPRLTVGVFADVR